ncbi:DUF6625 family protein [Pedobacter psychrotolerans]|nr:DUF6625 family protein [Pedobacter psychrotolerans]
MHKPKIAIIICFFGDFPWYFPFFLHSCKFNPDIDFLIFTDNEYDFGSLPNLRAQKLSMNEIGDLASKKLGFKVNIDFPYKLCDFKPAYGFLFSDYIKGYDFWGQSDIDIIYGNIRGFITDELLGKFDFISVRHDYTTGCFAIYRNCYVMNSLFKKSADFIKVFSEPKHYCFDECNFMHDSLTEGKSIFEIETEIESFTHVVLKAVREAEINAHFDFLLMEGIPGKIKFEQGKIFYDNKLEAILYHLYWLKRVYQPRNVPKVIPDEYKISPSRIYFRNKQIA